MRQCEKEVTSYLPSNGFFKPDIESTQVKGDADPVFQFVAEMNRERA